MGHERSALRSAGHDDVAYKVRWVSEEDGDRAGYDIASFAPDGGPGMGKSHVASALGIQAIEHHRKRVRFFSTVEWVNAPEQQMAQGKAGKIVEALVETGLVILEELGYLPSSTSGRALSLSCPQSASR